MAKTQDISRYSTMLFGLFCNCFDAEFVELRNLVYLCSQKQRNNI